MDHPWALPEVTDAKIGPGRQDFVQREASYLRPHKQTLHVGKLHAGTSGNRTSAVTGYESEAPRKIKRRPITNVLCRTLRLALLAVTVCLAIVLAPRPSFEWSSTANILPFDKTLLIGGVAELKDLMYSWTVTTSCSCENPSVLSSNGAGCILVLLRGRGCELQIFFQAGSKETRPTSMFPILPSSPPRTAAVEVTPISSQLPIAEPYQQEPCSSRPHSQSTGPRPNSHNVGDAAKGSVIDILTTSPMYNSTDRLDQRIFRLFFENFVSSPSYSMSRSPSSIISDTTSPDTCWPIHGSYGTIGLRLPLASHVARARLQRTDSAQLINAHPIRFRLWGLVRLATMKILPSDCTRFPDLFPSNIRSSLDQHHPVLLQSWTDDLDASDYSTSGTMCVVDVDRVVVEVWGRSDAAFICVNRIRLYGLGTSDAS